MKRTAKKYGPEQRIVVRSRADIPTHSASEDEEPEWWATPELADELLPDAETTDRLTKQHHALLRRLQTGEAGVHHHCPTLKRKRALTKLVHLPPQRIATVCRFHCGSCQR